MFRKKHHISLAFADTSVAYAILTPGSHKKNASLKAIGILENPDAYDTYVKCPDFRKAHTCVVLAPEDYQLFKVQKPESGDNDMHDSLLWEYENQISISPDNSLLYSFDAPENTTTGEKFLFFMVCDKARLAEKMTFLKKLDCHVTHVTIPELALAKAASTEDADNVCLIHLNPGEESIITTHKGMLHTSKRLPALTLQDDMVANESVLSSLVTLVKQAIVNDNYHIAITPTTPHKDEIQAHLHKQLNAPIHILQLTAAIESIPPTSHNVMHAIGGALFHVF